MTAVRLALALVLGATLGVLTLAAWEAHRSGMRRVREYQAREGVRQRDAQARRDPLARVPWWTIPRQRDRRGRSWT